jgi:hypothetical protein
MKEMKYYLNHIDSDPEASHTYSLGWIVEINGRMTTKSRLKDETSW